MRRHLWLQVFLLLVFGNASMYAQSEGPWQRYGTDDGEWRSYAGNTAGQKYSPLDQIDATNFDQLTAAWEWTTVDVRLSRTCLLYTSDAADE